MTERSRPWGGTTIGDAGPYSDDNWMRVWAAFMSPDRATDGVFEGQLSELNETGAVSPSIVNSGRAVVDGSWYESDANVSLVIPTPAANPRIDRIVLRKDFALQTVRVTRIQGTEAASPTAPAITQAAGVTWDLPLYQIFITVGGAITQHVDERIFIGGHTPTEISAGFVFFQDEFILGNLAPSNIDGRPWGHWFTENDDVNDRGRLNNTPGTATGGDLGVVQLFDGAGTGGGFIAFRTNNIFRAAFRGRFIFRVANPASNANLRVRWGFFSAIPTEVAPNPADGVYFRIDGVGNIFAVTRAGAAETATDVGAASGAYRDFEIRRGGFADTFLIDGVIVAIHTTNRPAVNLMAALVNAFTAAALNVFGIESDWVKFIMNLRN